MVAFEIDEAFKRGLGGGIHQVVVCDHCYARIVGAGEALLVMPPSPRGLPEGQRFQFESSVFHTHKQCSAVFQAAYREQHGATEFCWTDLWEHFAVTLANVATHDTEHAQRIYDAAEQAIMVAERKS